MEDLSSSTWKNRGSSVVFHPKLLGPLIGAGDLVSIRAALGWMQSGQWPQQVPGDGRTVLVGGLDTCLEVMDVEQAERFLSHRVKAFIQEFQRRWDMVGVVFGMTCSDKVLRVDALENVLYKARRGGEIRLSGHLWNGAARTDMARIVASNDDGGEETGGFYVPRLS